MEENIIKKLEIDDFFHHVLRKHVANLIGLCEALQDGEPEYLDLMKMELLELDFHSRQLIAYWDENKSKLISRNFPLTNKELDELIDLVQKTIQSNNESYQFINSTTEAKKHDFFQRKMVELIEDNRHLETLIRKLRGEYEDPGNSNTSYPAAS